MLKQFQMNFCVGARRLASPFRGRALLGIVVLLAIGGAASAQTPVGTVSNIPAPNSTASAFSTSLRFDSSGNLYAWDGLTVWKLTGGTGTFSSIGTVTAGNQADAGPICFSQDGQTLLLSNGAGGYNFTGNGMFRTMPITGGSAIQVTGSGVPYAYDALALPAASNIPGSSTKYLVNAGESTYTTSSLSVFDASTGSSRVVIDNGPGATTSIAINPQNHALYVGVGYGADQGKIYSFSSSQIDAAYAGTTISFSSGTLFNSAATGSQNGAGMFFDDNGYLFSGGDGITVFRPNGTICYDQSAGSADGYYESLTYDPATNEVLKVPYGSSTGTLYNAADFEFSGGVSLSSGTLIFRHPYDLPNGVALTDGNWTAPGDIVPAEAAPTQNLSAVPEPSAMLILAAMCGTILGLRRSWRKANGLVMPHRFS